MSAVLGMPQGLDTVVTGLAVAYRTYEEMRPEIASIVAFLQGMHPEHAQRIEEVLRVGELPTEKQQAELDAAVTAAERKAGG